MWEAWLGPRTLCGAHVSGLVLLLVSGSICGHRLLCGCWKGILDALDRDRVCTLILQTFPGASLTPVTSHPQAAPWHQHLIVLLWTVWGPAFVCFRFCLVGCSKQYPLHPHYPPCSHPLLPTGWGGSRTLLPASLPSQHPELLFL